MPRASVPRMSRLITRNVNLRQQQSLPVSGLASRRTASLRPSSILLSRPIASTPHHSRLLSTTAPLHKGLMPESDDPPAPQPTEEGKPEAHAAEISEAQYHELADEYLETVLSKFEELADEREDVDVEFAAGVLTVSFSSIGTYVINKQPPNKQIWLSSPASGPKRYDWAVVGDGQQHKGGTAAGDWVYLRDGSTLNDLFLDELDVDLSMAQPTYGE